MQLIGSDRYTLVMGLGKTGFACANYLARQGQRVIVADSREAPPYLARLRQAWPEIPVQLGGFEVDLCTAAQNIILSPGVPCAEPAVVAALASGVPVHSEIDLFAAAAKAPIVAITGSNAKSTVTSLVGHMVEQSGWRVAVGGNLGTPAVELLDDRVQVYVMELSSFQLETTHQLGAEVACVLNISPDHMDRYDNDLMAYHQAKHRIFQGCKKVVENADDQLTLALVPAHVEHRQFTLSAPDLKQYGVCASADEEWLCIGFDRLIKTRELALQGRHNIANSLAALALGDSIGLPREAMLASLRSFPGLAHRCEYVATQGGVTYINDSKGTNVGATVAAIEGLGSTIDGKVILLAGGLGKGADFSDLKAPMRQFGRAAMVYGQDGDAIGSVLTGDIDTYRTADMVTALQQARRIAQPGDLVLLSPACASFDAYQSFEQRGEHFCQLVEAQI
ncbi:MAG: UDP-N-acetylmuramoyl-L-alanine--D-glutamate ligase [Gammaproteobacteria bacterium]|jgi:UDP-N-acetylmuramoylalanine--D-glutamate ligase|nr:UDP-N-acetylmuramoyl-L-alanine--D-glutamate ligase [Gammaproteobacteria bacterium]